MEAILDSIQPVIEKSKFVKINPQGVKDFAGTITEQDFGDLEFNQETVLLNGSPEENIGLAIIFSSVNFSYWGEPKWTIVDKGRSFDGSFAMHLAIKRAIDQGYPLLSPDYLRTMPRQDLQAILAGNVNIPLLEERWRLLRSVGEVIHKRFHDSFSAVVEKGENTAVGITEMLVNYFPEAFNDEADYYGQSVKFYKKAQLLPSYLEELFLLGVVPNKVTSIDELTGFADYKIPQILRKYGILSYSPELVDQVDNKIEIFSGSPQEIEIRANTIWAVELLTRSLREKFPQANASSVDSIFWFRSQNKSVQDKPYHRTRTIWY